MIAITTELVVELSDHFGKVIDRKGLTLYVG